MIDANKLPEGHEVLTLDQNGDVESVQAPSDGGKKTYVVRNAVFEDEETGDVIHKWVCSCPAFEYGGFKPCKHMNRLGVGG